MFLTYVQHASISSVRFVEFDDPLTPSAQQHLYMLSLHLVLTNNKVINTVLAGLPRCITGFSVCWMMQHESSLVCRSLTAACLICSTPSYIGWTFINVFSISSESQFIGISRTVLPSTWWTGVLALASEGWWHGNPPQGNQELLVVKDKAGRPQVSLG